MIFSIAIAVVLAYLIGSVSVAYILARGLKGIDIRTVGSGNPGAWNVLRELGSGPGIIVLVLDAVKGVLAVYLPSALGAPHWSVFLTSVAVLAGHNWSPFLGFRGGKGVATVFGISFAMMPLITAAAAVPVALVIIVTRNVVLGGGLGFLLLNALTVATSQPGSVVALCLFLSVVVTATHLIGSRRRYMDAIRNREWGIMVWIE
ncbi:MAG: glycerol-3-phosphate acyltransferase [Chloroflexi bacterium]|nr:glycerol-3-phosphate acyltransferase [Chloroflexota bacterium]